jgi:hypothetical protein
MTDLNPVDAMTTDYRAMCAELVDAAEQARQALEGWANYGQWVWPESALEQAKRNTTEALALLNRARALLDQPKPPELTDAYLISAHDLAAGWNQQADAYNQWDSLDLDEQLAWAQSRAIAADRARYGRPTPQPEPAPVPVSERLPRPEDCTAQGRCWVFYRFFGFATWALEKPLGQDGKHTGYTHWLPSNALPIPKAKP